MRLGFVAWAAEGQQAHASTLVRWRGECFVAWFEGTCEGAPNTHIRVVRGGIDSPAELVATFGADDEEPHWNPVLAIGPNGRLWLCYRRGKSIAHWRTMVTTSADGLSWDIPRELVPGDSSGGRGPVRQAPVSFAGRWLAPGSIEVWGYEPRWDSFIDITEDGTNWRQVALRLDHSRLTAAGCIQPCLAVTDHGLIVLARSTEGCAFRAVSSDGLSFTELLPCALPNNNSGLAVVARNNQLLAVHNSAQERWGPRNRLVLSSSEDFGLTWAEVAVLEELDAGAGRPVMAGPGGVVTDGVGELSYPSALLIEDYLMLTYTWQRRAIRACLVPLTKVTLP